MTSKTLEQTKEVYKSCFLDEDFKDGGVHQQNREAQFPSPDIERDYVSSEDDAIGIEDPGNEFGLKTVDNAAPLSTMEIGNETEIM